MSCQRSNGGTVSHLGNRRVQGLRDSTAAHVSHQMTLAARRCGGGIAGLIMGLTGRIQSLLKVTIHDAVVPSSQTGWLLNLIIVEPHDFGKRLGCRGGRRDRWWTRMRSGQSTGDSVQTKYRDMSSEKW